MSTLFRTRASVIRGIYSGAISLAIGLILIPAGNTQKTIDPPRAGLEFRCPNYPIACCEAMTLRADVFGVKEAVGEAQSCLIGYYWDISGGRVISGQRTSEVTIYPDPGAAEAQDIRVTIKLDGVPPELTREKSCTITINRRCTLPLAFGEYDGHSLTEEKLRLDRLAGYLNNEAPTSVAFLVAYAGQDSCFWEAELWSERAKKYLVNHYKIQPDRVFAVDGGFRKNQTMEIFTSPRPSCGPFPKPTLLGSKASVQRSCGDKYKVEWTN